MLPKEALFTIIVVIVATAAFAQQPTQYDPPKWSGRVEVRVDVNQLPSDQREGLKATVGTYVNRELRTFNDISIISKATEEMDWVIWLDIIDIPIGPSTAGYAISMSVVQRPYAKDYIRSWLEPEKTSEKAINALVDAFSQGYHFRASRVYVTPSDKLQETCKAIVNEVDISFFEPERKDVEQVRESIMKARQKRNSQQ